MQYRLRRHGLLALAVSLAMTLIRAGTGPAAAQGYPSTNPSLPVTPTPQPVAAGYQQVNLVSDLPGMAARTDLNLVNPWGIAFAPGGPFWIADNGKGVSTVYLANGQPFPTPATPLVVRIPAPAGSTAAPTGMVFNGTGGFALAPGRPALFLFATEDGTISGWNPAVDATHAILKVNRAGMAVYKGLALFGGRLYAANFQANRVEVFNSSFSMVDSFTDPRVPAGFAPFGIQALGGTLIITYAKQNAEKHDDVKGPGNGFVDLYNPNTRRITRFISGLTSTGRVNAPLNSPWGLALAPSGFGAFSNMLLVGNFGDGWINAFDPRTGAFRGSLKAPSGHVIAIDGLWALTFATDPNNRSHPFLYFTAGIDDEQHGLFGRLQAVSGSVR